MSPIQDAIAAANALSLEEKLIQSENSRKYCVDRFRLARRYQDIQVPWEVKDVDQRLLIPQQELKLVRHINMFNGRLCYLWELWSPPLPRYSIAKKNCVSDTWITRFVHRHSDKLTSQ